MCASERHHSQKRTTSKDQTDYRRWCSQLIFETRNIFCISYIGIMKHILFTQTECTSKKNLQKMQNMDEVNYTAQLYHKKCTPRPCPKEKHRRTAPPQNTNKSQVVDCMPVLPKPRATRQQAACLRRRRIHWRPYYKVAWSRGVLEEGTHPLCTLESWCIASLWSCCSSGGVPAEQTANNIYTKPHLSITKRSSLK